MIVEFIRRFSDKHLSSLPYMCLVVGTFLYFTLPGLGSFLTVDEPRWINVGDANKPFPTSIEEAIDSEFVDNSYGRSEAYWDSYLSGDFKMTLNNSNPSATLSFLHLPAYIFNNSTDFGNYLLINRITILIHNIFFALFITYLVSKLSSRNNGILFFTSLLLLPQFIGFSQIINHSSIQGLYITGFLLSFWIALKTGERRFFVYSGCLYALSLLTQYTAVFLQIYLYIFPILLSLAMGGIEPIKVFAKNVTIFLVSIIFTSALMLPAIIFYPKFFFERLISFNSEISFFVIIFLFFTLLLLLIKGDSGKFSSKIYSVFQNFSKYCTRFCTLALLLIFSLVIIYHQEVVVLLTSNQSYFSLTPAVLGSFAMLLFSIPFIFLVALFLSLKLNWQTPTFNISTCLLFSFFFLIPIAVIASKSFSSGLGGYLLLDSRYLFVLTPILLAGIFTTNYRLPNLKFNGFFILIFSCLFIINYQISPFFITNNNILFPNGNILTKSVWARNSGIVSNQLNKISIDHIKVYSPRGRMEKFLNKNIEMIPWYANFWEEEPAYIVVDWEKNHRFSKIFDYYRENEEPVWFLKNNGTIITGIYKFNPNIDYANLIL